MEQSIEVQVLYLKGFCKLIQKKEFVTLLIWVNIQDTMMP